jgi:hypothetical protein
VLRRRHVATLATTSPAGRPHAAVVLYDAVDDMLWMSTMRQSRKGRNVAANPYVAVTVPFRRLPVGPPFALHFQATATVVERDDAALRRLAASGALPTVTAHGELDDADGVFLRVAPLGTVHSYGLGVNLRDLIRDPLHTGARSVVLA